ncbi:ribonuclease H-like domain-containing protein, partial [Tanacetum coccineum]
MEGEDEFHDDNPPPPPPPVTPTQQAPHTLSTIKLPILKKGEYDIWALKMEYYLGYTDYPIWEIIQKGNGLVQVSTDTNGQRKVLPLKTVEEILARERERKARTTLLLAIPEDHLILESSGSTCDSCGAASPTEDPIRIILVFTLLPGSTASLPANRCGDCFLLKALAALMMLVVFMVFLLLLAITYKGKDLCHTLMNSCTLSCYIIHGHKLDHEDLEQVDEFDLEEMDLKWQVAMISMRLKKFYKKTGRKLHFDAKEPVGFDKTKMSAKDKSGLGYGDQIHEGVLSYENEVFESVFDSRSSDVEDSPVYGGFVKVEEAGSSPSNDCSDFASCESDSSVETLELVPKLVVNEPKVVSKPKVWSDAPIIEEYESDSDDETVIKPSREQKKPSFAFINNVKHIKTHRESIKEQNTCSPNPKAVKRDWNGLMSKRIGLGYGFTRKACFVCGSFGHLIRDCNFHEKRMAKQVELNKLKGKSTGQGEKRPVWNNVQRLNHQNKFVPKALLTKTDRFPINAARQNLSSKAAATSTVRKVNTAGVKTVSVVGGKRETAVKASAGCNWRYKRHYWIR